MQVASLTTFALHVSGLRVCRAQRGITGKLTFIL
jgi:hypothetical protein